MQGVNKKKRVGKVPVDFEVISLRTNYIIILT